MVRVLHYLSGIADIKAGVETFILNLYEELSKRDIEFAILTRNAKKNTKIYKDFVAKGIKIYDLDCNRLGLKTYLRYYTRLKYFFKNDGKKFDFIHMHGVSDPFVISLAKKYGIKHSAIHTHSLENENKNIIKNFLKKYTANTNIKRADYLLACSKIAGIRTFKTNNFKVIHNGIKTDKFKFNKELREEYRNKLNIKKDEIAICFVGRFCLVKNIDFLVDIFHEIHQIIPQSKLFLIGDGEKRKSIEEKIMILNEINSVTITGQCEDVNCILQAMDIYMQPSISEGFSISALEAQCAGLPVFVSNGFPDEIMITDNIYKISLKESANSWAKKIINQLNKNNDKDRDKYKNIIYNSGYDSTENAKEMMEVYSNDKII